MRRRTRERLCFLGASALLAGLAQAQAPSCQPDWTAALGGQPGVNGDIAALVAFDDGSGPALYAGGTFNYAGGASANFIAKWDGVSWSPLGGGMNNGVSALAVYDDGGGLALYAGGVFTSAGGVAANRIAKWDGASWSPLGSGMTTGFGPWGVHALAVYDDGSGERLVAGGIFPTAGGVSVSNLASWDGAGWSDLGGGVDNHVAALTVFDGGAGPELVVGGGFSHAGGLPALGIARWNGTNWSALGGGVNGMQGIRALTVFDDGGGAALFAGGDFTFAGGNPANRIARWSGSSWTALGSGVDSLVQTPVVQALSVFDDGSGAALYAGGGFTSAGGISANRIARWSGSAWSALGSGIAGSPFYPPPSVFALAVFDDGSGRALCAGGHFTSAGGLSLNGLAQWEATGWSRLGHGLDARVRALATYDDGGGPSLYAAGEFLTAGGLETARIARWNGASWSALGSGLVGAQGGVDISAFALAVYDDGGGAKLYASGNFSFAGGVPVSQIASWNGSSWSAVGAGTNSYFLALAVFDDGSGPALYAGGYNASGGGASLWRWNGSSWTSLSGALSGNYVYALEVFDDGSGPALYAAGGFTNAGGVAVNHIARWDGASWSALGSGLGSWVYDLAVFDDGGGPALYAAGIFTSAGGVAANRVAKWNGTSWSALGSGMGDYGVNALGVFDDGSGAALYAGGSFSSAGGSAANRIAKWDGSSWSALGSGLPSYVTALAPFDDGGGPALFVGGDFCASPGGDSFVAEWGNAPGCGTPGVSSCEPGAAGVMPCPCGNPPAGVGLGCNNSSNTGGARLEATGIARVTYDTVVFTTSGERPTATSVVLQGDGFAPNGIVFGQGVNCTVGSLKRLYVKSASGGSITAPEGNDLRVHARSAALGDPIAPGTHRYYGVYYRDPNVLGGCAAARTYNITQQLDVLWSP
jgi:hypothetical protein